MTGNDYEQLKQGGEAKRDAGDFPNSRNMIWKGDYVRIRATVVFETHEGAALKRTQDLRAIGKVTKSTTSMWFVEFPQYAGRFDTHELELVDIASMNQVEAYFGDMKPTELSSATPEPDALTVNQAALIKRLEAALTPLAEYYDLYNAYRAEYKGYSFIDWLQSYISINRMRDDFEAQFKAAAEALKGSKP